MFRDYIIQRYMGLYSTAVGYEMHVIKTDEAGRQFRRVYDNVTAATMGRFYTLSNSFMTIEAPKHCGYAQYYRIVPDKFS